MNNRFPISVKRGGARLIISSLLAVLLLSLIYPISSVVEAAPWLDQTSQAVQIADLRKGSESSSPHALTPLGSTLFFLATEHTGTRLYKTNPPYDVLQRVSGEAYAGGDGTNPDEIQFVGDVVFFQAKDTSHGIELWKSEPPYTSAEMVFDINPTGDSNPKFMHAIGNALFFQASDGQSGSELWKTQPPYTSASRVDDIVSGGGSSNPTSLTSIGWTLFFIARASNSTDLWRSDPPYDETSTRIVIEANPDGDAHVEHLYRLENTLFFTALGEDDKALELWKCPPPYTAEVTVKVNDLDSWGVGYDPLWLHSIGDTLFYAGYSPASGLEVHKVTPPYDTTHTYLVMDLFPGTITIPPGILLPKSSTPRFLTSIGDTLFFTATEGRDGIELWKSDPPYDEAVQAADINPKGDSTPTDLTPIGNSLYFAATDGTWGIELWRSDPPYKQVSTVKVADLHMGGHSGKPNEITAVGSTLFFSADNGTDGRELWKIGSKTMLPSTGFTPNVQTRLSEQPAAQAYTAQEGMSLDIPRLGLTTSLVGVPRSLEGWNLDWLWNQAGYLEGTAFPTWDGNSAITAHVSLPNGQPGPFANLNQLRYDDTIIIHSWGQRYIYKMRSAFEVKPQDTSPISHEDRPWITLLTCQGYDPQTNAYRYRLAVRAVLVDVQND